MFSEALKHEFAGFEPISFRVPSSRKDAATVMPNEFAFVWRRRTDFWQLLSVIPHRTQERFAVDAGWSRRMRFPYDIQRPTPLRSDRTLDPNLDEGLFGFEDFMLIAKGSGVFLGWDVWKCSVSPDHPDFRQRFVAEDLAPVSDELADDRVRDAIALALIDIRTIVMPLLEVVAVHRA